MSSVAEMLLSLLSQRWRLTTREAQVLHEIMRGNASSKGLAEVLALSPSTAEKHLESIGRKAKLSGRGELTSFLLATFTDFLTQIDPSVLARHRARVGVVDDDRDLADSVALALQANGLEAYVVPFNDPGLLSIDKSPEALICDYVLGDGNGLSLVRSILDVGLGAPSVVLMTGYPDLLERETDLVETVLYKPLDKDRLVRAAWSAVTSAQLRRWLARQLSAS